jgi:flagellar biosynthesis component FlhA
LQGVAKKQRGCRFPAPSDFSHGLSYGEVQKLLKELPKEQSELIKDIVPSLITISGIQRVLQILLAERVSIRFSKASLTALPPPAIR